jgi:hypothetical protein
VDGEADEVAARMRAGVIATGPRPVAELFAWVFAELPEHLKRQREEALRFAGEGEEGDGRG